MKAIRATGGHDYIKLNLGVFELFIKYIGEEVIPPLFVLDIPRLTLKLNFHIIGKVKLWFFSSTIEFTLGLR